MFSLFFGVCQGNQCLSPVAVILVFTIYVSLHLHLINLKTLNKRKILFLWKLIFQRKHYQSYWFVSFQLLLLLRIFYFILGQLQRAINETLESLKKLQEQCDSDEYETKIKSIELEEVCCENLKRLVYDNQNLKYIHGWHKKQLL